jgi:hypothetical protein
MGEGRRSPTPDAAAKPDASKKLRRVVTKLTDAGVFKSLSKLLVVRSEADGSGSKEVDKVCADAIQHDTISHIPDHHPCRATRHNPNRYARHPRFPRPLIRAIHLTHSSTCPPAHG